MTFKVIRTFKPIEKMVSYCRECPYFNRVQDGNATLSVCEHEDYGNGGYDDVISDHKTPFPPRCPLVKMPV